ncbi:hypothetical protein AOLI_G00291060 [Acnodon oligacanthus]
MDTGHVGRLPSGLSICCSIPDMLYLPELVFGGLVWILVACTYIDPYNPQAYVMTVSLFCFVITFIWMMVFACGSHNNRASWAAAVGFGQTHTDAPYAYSPSSKCIRPTPNTYSPQRTDNSAE